MTEQNSDKGKLSQSVAQPPSPRSGFWNKIRTSLGSISKTVKKLNTAVVIGLFIASGSLLVSTISVVKTNNWNRKKSSHDTLLSVVGVTQFPKLTNQFHEIVPQKRI